MKKIFCITCHKLTLPLITSVKYLSGFKDNNVIIHVDKKTDLDSFLFLESENVFLLKNRISVCWGGVSQIQSTILLLQKSMEIDFGYLFFISGDDLPCVSNEYMNDFLVDIKFANIVHYQDSRNKYIDPIVRVKYKYPDFFFAKNKSTVIRFKKLIFKLMKALYINDNFSVAIDKGVVFYKGTNWFSLNRKTVSHTLSFINDNEWYLTLYKNSLCGDEVFFHSLFKYIGINDFYHDETKKMML